MDNVGGCTPAELQQALRPIASLISKSAKAQQKLAPGTWQHRMLAANLKALHLAKVLMTSGTDGAHGYTREDLQEALRALAALIGKAERAQAKFAPGTAPHTLQQNRLKALRMAEALTRAALDER